MIPQRLAPVVLLVALSSPLRPEQSASAERTSDLKSLSDSDLQTLVVHFERKRCYGTCPAYTVTIYGDGRVEYNGSQYAKVTGPQKGRIEAAAVRVLAAAFADAKFLSLPEDYTEAGCKCRRCTDMPSVITELTVGSVSHRVDHYYGCACAPKALFELESAIDKAANTEQWTGDTSKQGPFGTTCFG